MGSENSSAAALVGVVKRFGANVALDGGLRELKRALPMPAGTYLAAELVTAAVFATAVSLLLMLLGATVGKVVVELAQWASLFVLSVLGVIPFCGLGLLVGGLVKGPAAAAVLNLVHLPMSQYAVGAAGGEFLPHVLDLAGMGMLFFALSRRAFRKVR